MKKLSKKEAQKKIEIFFANIKNKTPKEVRKIKRLAMKHNIKLKELRKKFCKKCFSTNLKIKRIKRGMQTIECRNCKYVDRWKIKTS